MKNNLLLLTTLLVAMLSLASCEEKINPPTPTEPSQFAAAQIQLLKDYPQYNIEDAVWIEKDQYQIATFDAKTKVAAPMPSITVWYEIDGGFAERKLVVTKNYTLPDIIVTAFNATKYANAEIWTVNEIELENRFSENVQAKVYTVELSNIIDTNLEAEIYFNAETGELILAKEDLNTTDEENKYIVDEKLSTAIKTIYPDAIIIDASHDDNLIEADIIAPNNDNKLEIEITFTKKLKYVSSEYDVEYSKIPTKFATVKSWFENTVNNHPTPADTDEVEITEGPELIVDDVTCNAIIELEYETIVNEEQTELEVSFLLDADNKIVKVINETIEIRDKKLEAAVQAIYPNGIISEFSTTDSQIIAEVNTTEDGNDLEITMLFTPDYKHINSKYKLDYNKLPAKFDAIITWLETPQNRHPKPANDDEVEITLENLTINEIAYNSTLQLNYKGEQDGTEKLFEIAFFLNENNKIIYIEHNAEVWKYMDGTFVLNQGNMSDGLGSLIFINNNGDLIDNVYAAENPGKKLPPLASDLFIANNKMYILSQQGFLIVLNANTLKEIKRYDRSHLGEAGSNVPSHLAVVGDNAYIRNGETIFRFNMTDKTVTPLDAKYAAKGRMVVIKNKVYAAVGSSVVIIDNNTLTKITVPDDREGLSLIASDDGNLWLSGETYFSFEPGPKNSIMKMNVNTHEVEIHNTTYTMGNLRKDHPKIGAIGNKIYFDSDNKIICHDFAADTYNVVVDDIYANTDYTEGRVYNGVGINAHTNKLYLNILKGFGMDYLVNDILTYDMSSDKLEFNSKYSDYTRFPNGFHYTTDFKN